MPNLLWIILIVVLVLVLLGFFGRWQSELLIPLVYEREVRGMALFGAKRAAQEYSV